MENFELKINSLKTYDHVKGEECLDITSNLTDRVSRYYYEHIDNVILEAMSDKALEQLFIKINEEIYNRNK